MKFQYSSFNGLKVTVGTKRVTHPRTHAPTHAPKAICPINFFKVGGIITLIELAPSPYFFAFNIYLVNINVHARYDDILSMTL